jgi:SAM-dependent methyltransferase
MIDNTCRICGSGEYTRYLSFRGKNKEIIVCRNCKTFRTYPYSEIDYREHEFYCEHYLKNEKLFRGFAKALIDILTGHAQTGRLLDIGCSVGFVLEEAVRQGFQAEGIDLNEKAIAAACSKGLNARNCTLSNAGYEREIFDVIILNHLLEHIKEPGGFIIGIKKILKEHGLLMIGIPNHDSLLARVYKTFWYGWGIPEHIWHFDKRSLGNLLSKNGFKVKELVQNNQHYPFSKSLRKNIMAVVARIGNRLGMGDQLILVAEKAR